MLVSCSGGDNPDKALKLEAAQKQQILDGLEFKVIKDNTLVFENNSISGSGRILALQTLQDAKSFSFSLKFSLEDNGKIDFFAFANNQLEKAFVISVSRLGAKIKFELSKEGKVVDYSELEGVAEINAINSISLEIDLHNGENPAHMIMWNSALVSEFNEQNSILNTADEPKQSPGTGSGQFVGFELKDATLESFKLNKPHVTH